MHCAYGEEWYIHDREYLEEVVLGKILVGVVLVQLIV